MERGGKCGSGGKWHIDVDGVGVKVRVSIVETGVIRRDGIKIWVVEIVGVVGMKGV